MGLDSPGNSQISLFICLYAPLLKVDTIWFTHRITLKNKIMTNKIEVKFVCDCNEEMKETVVLVNSRFLQRPQKRNHGNQLIHRRFSKKINRQRVRSR